MRNRLSLILLALTGLPTGLSSSPGDEAVLLMARGQHAQALDRLEGASPIPRHLLIKGLALRRLGRDTEAVEPLRAAWSQDPGLLDAGVSLGLALRATGRWDEAEAAFRSTVKRHPRRAEPLLGLGMLAAGLARWQQSVEHYRAALKLAPKDAAAWAALSDAWLGLGRLDEAAQARQKALDLEPRDPELLLRQAALRYSLGQDAQARALLERANLPDRAEAYLLAGSILHRQGDLEGAEAQFLTALRQRPAYPEALLNLGINDYTRSRYLEAAERFSQLGPQEALYSRAQAYRREAVQAAVDEALRQGADAVIAGEHLEAVAHWARAEELAEDKAALRRLLASLREQQKPRAAQLAKEGHEAWQRGQMASALLRWNEALSVDPKQAAALAGMKAAQSDLVGLRQAHQQAARRLAQDGDLLAARDWARRLAALDAAAGRALNRELDAAVGERQRGLEAEAAQALKDGRPDEALRVLSQALALVPGDPALRTRQRQAQAALRQSVGQLLAQSLAREGAGALQPAYQLLQQALRLEPGNLEARRHAERLAQRLELKRMDPREVDRLYYEGVYLYGAGDTRKAMDVWRRALEAAPSHAPLRQALRSAEQKLRSLALLGEQG